jgi:hypothetical protein
VLDGNGVRAAATGLPAINTTVPHPARVWDYWLGGRDNFAIDRRLGDRMRRRFPVLVDSAGTSRQFLTRAVRHLAGEARLDQFLDLGSGLPTAGNTHETARAVVPASRIVYVDNDPLVVVHARALLAGTEATAYLDADVRDPGAVLAGAAQTLDLTRPVAVLMVGLLDALHDDTEARRIVATVMAGVPSGSHLALSHPTLELGGEQNGPATRYWNARTRTRAQVAGLLTGLELVEPGLVSCGRWRPSGRPVDVPLWGVVARKP